MRLMDKCVGGVGNVGETDAGGDDDDDDDDGDDDDDYVGISHIFYFSLFVWVSR